MRPAAPYRRHSAIAVIFAAWCAAYGLPVELARNLTAQTVGLSQLSAAGPSRQGKVLLGRLSHQVRRADTVHLPFFDRPRALEAVDPAVAYALRSGALTLDTPAATPPFPVLFQRPPPALFPA